MGGDHAMCAWRVPLNSQLQCVTALFVPGPGPQVAARPTSVCFCIDIMIYTDGHRGFQWHTAAPSNLQTCNPQAGAPFKTLLSQCNAAHVHVAMTPCPHRPAGSLGAHAQPVAHQVIRPAIGCTARSFCCGGCGRRGAGGAGVPPGAPRACWPGHGAHHRRSADAGDRRRRCGRGRCGGGGRGGLVKVGDVQVWQVVRPGRRD